MGWGGVGEGVWGSGLGDGGGFMGVFEGISRVSCNFNRLSGYKLNKTEEFHQGNL